MKLPFVEISNEYLKIIPTNESHIGGLVKAGGFSQIWQFMPIAINDLDKSIEEYILWTIEQNKNGQWLAHTILTPENEYVGQTCYMTLRLEHLSVEIGGTWYSPKFWKSKINPAAKYAMLENGFKNGARRIELKTDDRNKNSQAAIIKLGAKFEGVFRNHMVRPDGSARNTHYYSIIKEEWPQISQNLMKRLSL